MLIVGSIKQAFKTKLTDNQIIYKIDRNTPLGNPFILDKESDRNSVCQAYRVYLWLYIRGKFVSLEEIANHFDLSKFVEISNRTEVIRCLNYLLDLELKNREVTLACWCAPKQCHGDIIKSCIEWKVSTGEKKFLL